MKNETRVKVTNLDTGYAHRIESRAHVLTADEPTELGGTDQGPTPYELLLAALGSCSAITVRIYANRKNWPLEDVTVQVTLDRIHAKDCEDCEQETGFVDVFVKEVDLQGPLTSEQRQRLTEIADRCPVHRTLSGATKIQSSRPMPPALHEGHAVGLVRALKRN